jgi:hypothetical protein
MSNPESVPIAKRVQYGALPYRVRGRARPEIMLVTSRETRRWIIPKGWPKKGKSARQSAGRVSRRAVGSFSYETPAKASGPRLQLKSGKITPVIP